MNGEPVTAGRRFGLGRSLPTPREHCKRCSEITDRADQMVMNYVMANGRQVEIINRLMKDPDGAKEVVALGQLLAEKDALIMHIYQNPTEIPHEYWQEVQAVIDNYREEVDGDRGGEEGTEEGERAQAQAGAQEG